MWPSVRALRGLAGPAAAAIGHGRSVATLSGALHARGGDASALALAAPAQGISWSRAELTGHVNHLAGVLTTLGYTGGDVIATDLASCAENLVLQLAASHLGLAVLTLKDEKGLGKFGSSLNVKGAMLTGVDSFLAQAGLPLPCLTVADAHNSTGEVNTRIVGAADGDAPLGYYSSAAPVTNAAAMAAGSAAREKLEMTEKDVVLVSITLNHLFGIGSAVSAALQSGAAIVLPDASGVVGCGSPSQRAQKTLEFLDALGCTLLYADTHTHKALIEAGPGQLKNLRGGICKIGSGTTFLESTADLSGVKL
eukprot:CAMPEP_0115452284 /NCGR_PEP_ID=MMETSP0271-20121206/42513_1 /TAXON_ID=71861 /ORGANISM="Scrippsiella trochoidea, Strain CCMP3099" /LENGTH=308 /DNA_ID=CAMNT_0002878603 /DNA_START=67 /DNA_END=989 /DNA_ORIENTATION=-